MIKMVDGGHWLGDGTDDKLEYGHASYQIPWSFIKTHIMDDGTEIYSRGKHGRMVKPITHPVWGDGVIVDKVKYVDGEWIQTVNSK